MIIPSEQWLFKIPKITFSVLPVIMQGIKGWLILNLKFKMSYKLKTAYPSFQTRGMLNESH